MTISVMIMICDSDNMFLILTLIFTCFICLSVFFITKSYFCLSLQADHTIQATVDVQVVQTGSTQTAGQFTYDPSGSYTPVISALSQNTSDVWGEKS